MWETKHLRCLFLVKHLSWFTCGAIKHSNDASEIYFILSLEDEDLIFRGEYWGMKGLDIWGNFFISQSPDATHFLSNLWKVPTTWNLTLTKILFLKKIPYVWYLHSWFTISWGLKKPEWLSAAWIFFQTSSFSSHI